MLFYSISINTAHSRAFLFKIITMNFMPCEPLARWSARTPVPVSFTMQYRYFNPAIACSTESDGFTRKHYLTDGHLLTQPPAGPIVCSDLFRGRDLLVDVVVSVHFRIVHPLYTLAPRALTAVAVECFLVTSLGVRSG